SAILWKPPAHSPEENMVRQKCSGIRRSYLGSSLKSKSGLSVTFCFFGLLVNAIIIIPSALLSY
ncbi:hypothetical protein, partial [Serratia nevei]|uniref:hypothetical protein n=1 Tax=Serratia nevei TaxID=2703794 RepID=UPI00254BDD2C